VPALDLLADPVDLAAALVDIPSESHHERELADLVETALRVLPHLQVTRIGDTVVARTALGLSERVLIGGHLDTVPAAGNLPSLIADGRLYGLGACDMKGGVAVGLHLAATVTAPTRDVTYVFYACEEVASQFNGLQQVLDTSPDLLVADLAILMEPSDGGIEAGCQGTLRVRVMVQGTRAHSARSWLGVNAVHGAGEILRRLDSYSPREPMVDGLRYREGLSAVRIEGGVAGNVIPDECVVTINYRFAPDLSVEEALAHVRVVLEGYDIEVEDAAAGARPGLDRPAAASFVAAVGAEPRPKYGWTDVARFSALGVPALNFGPGDPSLAHTKGEYAPIEQIRSCALALRGWLS
jgi:succinyl-diaminopimelate desuccinylase